jgi:hypothetical protein
MPVVLMPEEDIGNLLVVVHMVVEGKDFAHKFVADKDLDKMVVFGVVEDLEVAVLGFADHLVAVEYFVIDLGLVEYLEVEHKVVMD